MNTKPEEQKIDMLEVEALLSKASGIVRVISLGLLDNKEPFDETLLPDIRTALWSAYDHIDEARKLLGVDDETINPKESPQ